MNTEYEDISPDASLEKEALQNSLHLFDDVAQEDHHLRTDHDALYERVLNSVVEYLTRNPERLMSVLYRIDVSEEKVQGVMKNAPVGSIAPQLTKLIIDRMREKILTRRTYSKKSS